MHAILEVPDEHCACGSVRETAEVVMYACLVTESWLPTFCATCVSSAQPNFSRECFTLQSRGVCGIGQVPTRARRACNKVYDQWAAT